MSKSTSTPVLHAVIVGGGPAGLQAALTLGRMHRPTVLFDSGEYRNAAVAHAHNLLTHDGRPPAELRALGRAELTAYTSVQVRDEGVELIERHDDEFVVRTHTGDEVRAKTVILATGMRDELPPIEGLAQEWGNRVAQCPFCHGHEYAGQEIAVVGVGMHAQMISGMLGPIASGITVIDPAELVKVDSHHDALTLTLSDGRSISVAGLFVAAVGHQRAPFGEQLGCRLLDTGCLEIDPMGATTVPGVYAAGDLAHIAAVPGPMVSLAAAIAAGQLAAVSTIRASLPRQP